MAVLAVTGMLSFGAPDAAHADVSIAVTTTADVVDGGDGVVSLREAIDQANLANEPVVISLANVGSYSLTHCTPVNEPTLNRQGVLDLRTAQPVTIHGNGSTVTQTCDGRAHLDDDGGSGATTNLRSIDHLSLTAGKGRGAGSLRLTGGGVLDHVAVTGTTMDSEGGAAVVLGTSLTTTTSTLIDSTIQHTNNGTALIADGFDTASSLVLLRTHLLDNRNPFPGANYDTAGGLRSTVRITATDSEIARNTGILAGGIAAPYWQVDLVRTSITGNTGRFAGLAAATARLTDSTVSGNSAGSGGTVGGLLATVEIDAKRSTIANNNGGFGGIFTAAATIHQSTISGNTGYEVGGVGIAGNVPTYQQAQFPDHSEVIDTTISGNVGGLIGGVSIANNSIGQPATPIPVTVASSTLAGNRSTGAILSPPGPHADELGYYIDSPTPPQPPPATLTLRTSAIGDGAGTQPDCSVDGQTVVSQGYNVVADASCGIGSGPGDLPNAGDPISARSPRSGRRPSRCACQAPYRCSAIGYRPACPAVPAPTSAGGPARSAPVATSGRPKRPGAATTRCRCRSA